MSQSSSKETPFIWYTESIEHLTPEKLQGFFVGWPNKPSPEIHLDLLKKSDHRIMAVNEQGEVVGFMTAITDGVLSAYIPFLEVLPDYQNRGIGQELITKMLEKLNQLYMIDLSCDPNLQPFYERFGMEKSVGMRLRHFSNQNGESR